LYLGKKTSLSPKGEQKLKDAPNIAKRHQKTPIAGDENFEAGVLVIHGNRVPRGSSEP